MLSLEQIQNDFLVYLHQNEFQKLPQNLYAPINYIMNLGGKRLRPALLLMSYNLFEDNIQSAMPLALAAEIFHNFSLVHDDIMDAAPLRRGKATVHTKYNTNTAILSGDVMLIYAYEYLRLFHNQKKLPQLLHILNKTAIEVCEGQQYDMDFESRNDVTIAEYLLMIELKTAVLLAGAMQMGAIAANATTKNAKNMYEFGRNIGIAFQIQDDILDTFGNPEKFGKKVGGDIVQNKKTYLILKALSLTKKKDKERLLTLMNTPTIDETAKINEIIQLLEHYKVREAAEMLQNNYQQKAFNHLDAVSVGSDRKSIVRTLAEEMLKRDI